MNIDFASCKNVALGNVIEQLEAHWAVLEGEVREIASDLKRLNDMKAKYGDCCDSLINHLTDLKQERKKQLRRIQEVMSKFDFDAQKGITLLKELDDSRM